MSNVIGAAVIILFFALPFLISRILGMSRLPEEAERILGRREGIVCRYNTYIYSFLMEISLLCTIMFALVSYRFLMEGQVAFFTVFAVLMLAFLAMALMFFLYQKNWMLVLFEDGIVFRNSFGEVYCCANEKILSCNRIVAYRRDEMRIVTPEKKICMNYYCKNYREAATFLSSKSYYR